MKQFEYSNLTKNDGITSSHSDFLFFFL